LKVHEFLQQSWQGQPPILVAAGLPYHSSQVVKKAKASFLATQPDAVQEKLEAPDKKISDALDLYQTLGLWGQCRLVELHLDKPLTEKENSADREQLLQVAQQEPQGNVLLIRVPTLQKSKWLAELMEHVAFIDCGDEKAKKGDTQQWVLVTAIERNLNISRDGAKELVERLGNQPGILDNALTLMELSSKASQSWGKEQVQLFFTQETQSSVFDLADALANQDLKKSLTLMKSIFDRGTMVVELLGGLRLQFRRILLLKFHEGQWGRQTMASKLGIHPYYVEKTLQQVKKFNLPHLRKVYNELYRLDKSSKSSSLGDRDLFEMFILRLFFGS
jgi:DNA polymerase-3 subunit delta